MKKIITIVVLLLVLVLNFAHAQKTTAMEYAMATDNAPYNGVTDINLYNCLVQNNGKTNTSTNGLGFFVITVKHDSVDVTFIEHNSNFSEQTSIMLILTRTTTVGIASKIFMSGGPDPFYPSGRGVADKVKMLKGLCGIK